MFTSDTLTTERLLLRRYEPSDLDTCVALFTDPDVMRYVGDGVVTPEEARTLFAKCFEIYDEARFDIWAVLDRETGAFVGHAELKPRKSSDDVEIIYILNGTHWGRGYGTEIARLLVDRALRHYGLPRVLATVDYENTASRHVLEKAGMRFLEEERDEVGSYAVYAADGGR